MIQFREIDKSNYMECLLLHVSEDQKGFVADNAQSLAEAHFEEGLYTRGIYSDEVMVGFVLFDYDQEIPGWSMSRFMIGKQFQHMGLGKAAISQFLKFMKEEMNATELFLSVSEANTTAIAMYEKLGFHFYKKIEYEFAGVPYRENQMKINL